MVYFDKNGEKYQLQIKITLNELLIKKKIKKAKLSSLTGIKFDTILRMCNNKSQKIDIKTLEKICACVNCELTELLTIKVRKVRKNALY